ncbi:MAG: hypothetical protein HC900_00050 [Methylacidiphilales bacterium]|nr:hypothetical protein [Candidatus Methylacidiphilales bacterium]
MPEVRALYRGYHGGAVREPGERFRIPDKDWNDPDRKRPSWVEEVGAKALAAADLQADRGDEKDTPPAAAAKKGKDNGVQDALGGPAPDWLPPGAAKAVMVDK